MFLRPKQRFSTRHINESNPIQRLISLQHMLSPLYLLTIKSLALSVMLLY